MIRIDSLKFIYFWFFLSLSFTYSPYFGSSIGKYVGDNNATKIFKSSSSKNEIIGILFTNKYCEECHSYDAKLQGIISSVKK